jgi:hypothetical protein
MGGVPRVRRRGKLKLITIAQVEEFERTYFSLHRLTLEQGRHFRDFWGNWMPAGFNRYGIVRS